MEIFRICKSKYALELKASGNPGRWNFGGEHIIYCAASRALAALEVLIHTSGEQLSITKYKILVIYIPDDLAVTSLDKSELPENWNGLSSWSITQRMGSYWIRNHSSPILKVPSSIVIKESNYLINENHPEFKRCRIIDVEDYLCDARLVEKIME